MRRIGGGVRMYKVFFISSMLVFSTVVNSQTTNDRLKEISNRLDDIEFEQQLRETQRLIREQEIQNEIRNLSRPLPNSLPPINHNLQSKTCYLIWNGESFQSLNSKQFNLFSIEIVDSYKVPIIEVYLPKSYQKDTQKINKFIKNNIEKIKSSCQK